MTSGTLEREARPQGNETELYDAFFSLEAALRTQRMADCRVTQEMDGREREELGLQLADLKVAIDSMVATVAETDWHISNEVDTALRQNTTFNVRRCEDLRDAMDAIDRVRSKRAVEQEKRDTGMLPVQFRWLIDRDMDRVVEIENESFEFPTTREELEDRRNSANSRDKIGMVVDNGENRDSENTIYGYFIYQLHKSMLQILNFAVSSDARRRGVGRQMVEKLIDKLTQQRRNELFLEIRESNLEAQLFFKEMGFKAEETVRNHYGDTGESAIVMAYRLEETAEAERPAEDLISSAAHLVLKADGSVDGLSFEAFAGCEGSDVAAHLSYRTNDTSFEFDAPRVWSDSLESTRTLVQKAISLATTAGYEYVDALVDADNTEIRPLLDRLGFQHVSTTNSGGDKVYVLRLPIPENAEL